MAEAVMAARMPRGWHGLVEVSSAGTAAWEGARAARTAVSVLSRAGIDLSSHRARRVTPDIVERSDLVIAMEEAHREEMVGLVPGSRGRIVVFGELDPSRGCPDVPDPIGGDEDVYRRTFEEIGLLVALLISYVSEKYELAME